MIISGQAKVAGVIGYPVKHSKSPKLHGYWLEKYGIDGAYVPLEIKPEDFEKAVLGLKASGFKGCNVTVPHKEAAYRLADEVGEHAKKMGSGNTLVFREDGSIFIDNTDGYGFIENIFESVPSWKPEAGPAMVLGAGGAARAIVVGLADAGVPEILLTNRTRARAETLAEELDVNIRVIDWEDRSTALSDCAFLTNTTTLGMHGQPDLEIDLTNLSKEALVNDIVYVPLMTDLLKQAQAHGCQIVDGLGMLLHQGRPGFKEWFGTDPKVDADLRDFVLKD
jgi:shikimate dehydrogenase